MSTAIEIKTRVPPRRRRVLVTLAIVIAATITSVICVRNHVLTNPLVFNESCWQHEHCIHAAAVMLQTYADTHEGRFPYHVKGYPQALLLLDGPLAPFTGPGFDPENLDQAKLNGAALTEADCGRVYIQGLTVKSNGVLAILFDKIPSPGDHCTFPRRLWAEDGREVLMVGGHCRFIAEIEWAVFSREQIELLVAEGFPRAEAERLYEVTAK